MVGLPQRVWLASILLLASPLALGAEDKAASPPQTSTTPGHFVDTTQQLGIHFQQQSSPTSKKYLLETMGS